MANKLIKIVVDLENKAADQFKELNKQLKELKNNSDDAAASLSKIGKNQKQNTNDTKKNTQALNQNSNAAEKNSDSFANLKTNALASLAALTAISAVFLGMAKNAVDVNKELNLLAANAGINANEFKKLSFVYGAFGVEASNVASAFKDIAERVNDAALNNAGEFIDIGKQLGLDAKTLNNLPTEILGDKVLKEIARIDNENTRLGFADRLASDVGIQLVELTRNSGKEIKKLQKEFDKLNLKISPEDAQQIKELGFEFDKLATLISVVNQEIVAEFSPALKENIQDFTLWITKLREGRSELFELIKGYASFLNLSADAFITKFSVEANRLNLALQKVVGSQEDINKAQKEFDASNQQDYLNFLKIEANNQETKLKVLIAQNAENKKLTDNQKKQIENLLELKELSEQSVINVSRISALQQEIGKEGKKTAIFNLSEQALAAQLQKDYGKVDLNNIEIKPKTITLDPNSTKVIDASKEARTLILGKTDLEIKKINLKEDKKQFGSEFNRLLGDLSTSVEKNKFSLDVYTDGSLNLEKSRLAVENFKKDIVALQEEAKNGLSEKLFNDADKLFQNLKDSGASPAIVKNLEDEFKKRSQDFKDIFASFNLKELDVSIEESQKKSDLFFKEYELGIKSISSFQNEYNKLLQTTKERYGENSIEYQDLKNRQIEINNMLFQKEIDNLEFLRQSNKITIDEQIAGYEKLRSQVSKNSEMFKTLSTTIEQLNIENFNQKVERTSLEIDLNKKSVDDLISVYEEQIKKVDETSLEYLQLNAVLKDLKDQKISEEFERINLEMQLGTKNIDDLIKNYERLIASTPEGSLENLSARVGKKQAEDQKQDETEALYESQIRSGNLTFQERNALLEEYQNYLISQRDLLEEGTQQYYDQEQKIKGLNEEFSTLFLTFEDLATMGTDSLTDGLMNVVEGTGSVKDAFKSMAQSILQDLTQMILRAYIYQAIMASLGIAGVPTGGNIFNAGSLFASVPMRHNEGSVSSVDDSRNSFKKINMLKPQSSLSNNERLIVARTDEYVVKKPNINSPTGNGSTSVQSPNISIQNIITDQMIADTMKNSDAIRDAMINIFQFNRDRF